MTDNKKNCGNCLWAKAPCDVCAKHGAYSKWRPTRSLLSGPKEPTLSQKRRLALQKYNRPLDEIVADLDYWKRRCDAAEDMAFRENPEQFLIAHRVWQKICDERRELL